jgi:hypothetical protein
MVLHRMKDEFKSSACSLEGSTTSRGSKKHMALGPTAYVPLRMIFRRRKNFSNSMKQLPSYSYTLKMDAIFSSETLLDFQRTIRSYVPKIEQIFGLNM